MKKDELLFNNALSAHQQGDLEQAETLYQEFLTLHPTHVQALDLLGIVFAQCSRYSLAVEHFQAALEIEPKNVLILTHLASVVKSLGDYEQAKHLLTKAIKNQPDCTEALYKLGLLYQEETQYTQAQHYYSQALHYDNTLVDVLHSLALTLLKERRLPEAKEKWLALLKQKPDHVQSHFYLGIIAYEGDDFVAAERYFRFVLEKAPNHVESLSNLGAVLLKKNAVDEAMTLFNNALSIDPSDLFARTNLAATLLTQGEVDKAKKEYIELLTFVPQDFTAHFNLGAIFIEQRKWESASYHLKTAHNIDPHSFPVLKNLGNVFLKLHERDDAIKCYRRALSLSPDDETVSYLLTALTRSDAPQSAPRSYVEELFDNYAQNYDSELLDKLQYKVPELLHQTLLLDMEQVSDGIIVDLGCGTGLCGEHFKPYSRQLIGVDVSKKMLIKAQEKKLYTQLIHADINDGMTQLNDPVNLFLATDVLVYIGDLQYIFSTVYRLLAKEGLFAFTLEAGDEFPYQLLTSGRFAHHADYVKTLALPIGFTIHHNESLQLRTQKGQPVMGRLYVLQK